MIDLSVINQPLPWYRQVNSDNLQRRLPAAPLTQVPVDFKNTPMLYSFQQEMVRRREVASVIQTYADIMFSALRVHSMVGRGITECFKLITNKAVKVDVVSLDLEPVRSLFPQIAHVARGCEMLLQSKDIGVTDFHQKGLNLLLGAYEALFALAVDPELGDFFPIAFTSQQILPLSGNRDLHTHIVYASSPEEVGLVRSGGLTGSELQRITYSLAHFLGESSLRFFAHGPSTIILPSEKDIGLGVSAAMMLYLDQDPTLLPNITVVERPMGGGDQRAWVIE